LIRIIDSIETKEIENSSYISLFSDFTAPLDGNEIRNWIQDTYNVTISLPVDVRKEFSNERDRGGMSKASSRKPPGSFSV
jgi:hypothetical protein